jgi:UV DNA damage endonuclease
MSEKDRMELVSDICLHNAESLMASLQYCNTNGIRSFRINSQILPLKTHPEWGYEAAELPVGDRIVRRFRDAGDFCRKYNIRTTFHPDQFIVLSSPREDVVESSIRDLAYQAEVAEWVNADVINIHAGGVYNDKKQALDRLRKTISSLPGTIRKKLTLENDDRLYAPQDLFPVCAELGVPLVYDVHHHRCHPDGLSEETATELTLKTWDREPLFHVSSPLNRQNQNEFRKHHAYIDPADVPLFWKDLNITLEVEAKDKELAVKRLKQDLGW